MIIYNDGIAILGSFLFCIFYENFLHKVSHYKESGQLYRWHKLHHKDYPAKQLESDIYINSANWYNNMFVFWICMTQLWMYCLSSFRVFTIFTIETTLYSFVVSYFHEQFHIKQSWWLRYKWFRHFKQNHLIHHIKHTQNFGMLTNTMDKLYQTYIYDNQIYLKYFD